MNQGWIDRDRNIIWHPYTPQKYAPSVIPVAKGDGVYLIDFNGKKYIDAISSWWVTLHGHANSFIADRIFEQAKQLEQVIFAGFTHPPAILLAEALLSKLPPSFSKIFYSDNGSTATEVALKMALQYWWNQDIKERNIIIALKNSYHGDTFGAMSMSERGVFTLAFHDRLFDVQFIDQPQTGESVNSEIPWEKVACLIYEPLVQGAGGMIMYEPSALNDLLLHCKSNGVICIADEVMTGFFRTGTFMASEQCEVQPDIICMSKGLTGGVLPLGVTACTENIHKQFISADRKKTFFHGHSFTANPLSCAAALASFELLYQPNCQEQIRMIETEHRKFSEWLSSTPNAERIINPRVRGTILAFEMQDPGKDYLSTVNASRIEKSLELGVVLRPLGNTLYVLPPYCIRREELHQVYNTIKEII